MPTFRCSQCDFEKQVSEDLVGQRARCPKCKEVSVITNDPVVPDVIELEDDASDELWSDLPIDQDAVDDDVDDLISEDVPRRKKRKPKEDGSLGIPKPRSFLTTAILAGGFFGIGMGAFAAFKGGFGAGILAALICGPLFGFVMAFFVSGRQVAVQFESRDAFIKDMKRAFKKVQHEVIELSDPLFTFKHEAGAAFFCTTHVHVGRREAIFVGPRTYVKKCVLQLSDRHQVDWTGKKPKENHGEVPTDSTAQYAWIAVFIVLLVMSSGLKDLNSPVGKAKAYVRSRVKVPSGLKFISARVVREDADGKRVEVVFEAPNSFGVMLRDSMTVVVKSDGNVGEM